MSNTDTRIVVSNAEKIKALAASTNTMNRFAALLGSRSDASSYISSAMLAVMSSDTLVQCTPSSNFNTVLRAAALRLSCDPSLRQAHIVPFRNNKKGGRWEAHFIPGYIGLKNVAQRTGKYRYLNAHELYEGQILDIDQLTGETHLRGSRVSDKIMGYFHFFELFSGFSHCLYMSVEELQAHAQRYAPKNPLWTTHFHDMALKTVTRLHLLKDGILDPFDRNVIVAASEDIEGEIDESNIIDSFFTDADDLAAEKLAIEAKTAAIDEQKAGPKMSEKQLNDQLYGTEGVDEDQKNGKPLTDKTASPSAGPGTKKAAPESLKPQPAFNSEALRERLLEDARSQPVKDVKRETNKLAAGMGEALGGDKPRHDFIFWLTDGKTEFTKDLDPQMIMALFRWIKPAYDRSKSRFVIDKVALNEMLAVLDEVYENRRGPA